MKKIILIVSVIVSLGVGAIIGLFIGISIGKDKEYKRLTSDEGINEIYRLENERKYEKIKGSWKTINGSDTLEIDDDFNVIYIEKYCSYFGKEQCLYTTKKGKFDRGTVIFKTEINSYNGEESVIRQTNTIYLEDFETLVLQFPATTHKFIR